MQNIGIFGIQENHPPVTVESLQSILNSIQRLRNTAQPPQSFRASLGVVDLSELAGRQFSLSISIMSPDSPSQCNFLIFVNCDSREEAHKLEMVTRNFNGNSLPVGAVIGPDWKEFLVRSSGHQCDNLKRSPTTETPSTTSDSPLHLRRVKNVLVASIDTI